ncbi:MAG: hypothetical protein M1834_001478 [Cirrosporium novae-zelandiae]|nr:MAG: hypothetical protein M1834_001478 [Cirrosporium novae-zelandiae]
MATVRVIARVRPLLPHENDRDIILRADTDTAEIKIPNPKNVNEEYKFKFQAVFDAEAGQGDLFDGEVAATIPHLFKGHDVTLFAYGVTGTGKTHTMRGGRSLADRGMIPRLLSAVFRRAKKLEKASEHTSKQTTIEVRISYYEIYNDKVFDLLEAPEKRTPSGLPMREAGGGKVVLVGLTEKVCSNVKEFESLYDKGNGNRSTAGTKLNAVSSRSHAILSVKVMVTTAEEGEEPSTRVSTASAIDLAGSEDNRRTENVGGRMIESASINRSLFVLAQCVEAISKKQHRIPYRESKMTRILSLGQNNGLTVMILNLAPVKAFHLDTLSSLNFANRTKKIENRDIENEPLFKGPPRAVKCTGTSSGESIASRQPLRPLASVANKDLLADKKDKDKNKPKKEFNVYLDRGRTAKVEHTDGILGQAKRMHEPPKRSSPLKRNSSTDPFVSSSGIARPTKAIKATQSHIGRPAPTSQFISKEIIESLVQQKVEEILAARKEEERNEKQSQSGPEISEEVQRRLDELEKKISKKEADDDGRAEGLTYLLMGKQHQIKGEYKDALEMYEMAKKWFPENKKLDGKIKAMRGKLIDEDEMAMVLLEQETEEPVMIKMPLKHRDMTWQGEEPSEKVEENGELEYDEEECDDPPFPEDIYEEEAGSDYDSDDGFRFKSKSKSLKSKPRRKQKANTKVKAAPMMSRPKSLVSIGLSASSSASSLDAISVPSTTTSNISSSSSLTSAPINEDCPTPRTIKLLQIVNSRDVTKIRLLRGVGAKKAEAILEGLNGCEWKTIRSLEELESLKGVGVRSVDGMRAGLSVEEE